MRRALYPPHDGAHVQIDTYIYDIHDYPANMPMLMPFVVVAPASSSVTPAPRFAHYPVSFLSSSVASLDFPGRIRFSYRNVSLPRLCSIMSAELRLSKSRAAYLLNVVSSSNINDHILNIR